MFAFGFGAPVLASSVFVLVASAAFILGFPDLGGT